MQNHGWTLFLAVFLLSLNLQAGPLPSHTATESEARQAYERNLRLPRTRPLASDIKPVPDTADFAYVLMTAMGLFANKEVTNVRKIIAQNLPAGVKFVVLTPALYALSTRIQYSKWIPANRLVVLTDFDFGTENGFWARDSFPIPVMKRDGSGVSLVAHKYFRNFNSHSKIAGSVGGKLNSQPFTFVGGNLLADEAGNCFVVDSDRRFGLRKEDFQSVYGCSQVHFIPWIAGIGDVDEVLKPLPGGKMLTNQEAFKPDLEALGYEVVMLPKISGYRTYANSLVVKDTVFMPSYGVAEDSKAAGVYEGLGYKVVPVPSKYLSDALSGSIHCQTMAYPKMNMNALVAGLREALN